MNEYYVKCLVCGQIYKNHSGSTPCCGALAFVLKKDYYRRKKLNTILKNI